MNEIRVVVRDYNNDRVERLQTLLGRRQGIQDRRAYKRETMTNQIRVVVGDYNKTLEWSDYKHFSGDVKDYKIDAPANVKP